ncbi:MAG: FHA domain-containing protein [Myxococcaceae bacterium]
MNLRFSVIAAQLLADPIAFRRRITSPLLLWQVGSSKPSTALLWVTDRGTGQARPTVRDPMVLEVKKALKPRNGFAMGVTVGRTQNNDVIIDDATVSRFHAYFRQDPNTGVWSLVDAESQNGTFRGTQRLAAGRPVPLFEQAEISVGDVALSFFSPAAFEQHVADESRRVGLRPRA